MPLRLDLAAMRAHELQRALPRGEYLATRPALTLARLTRQPIFAPDDYPETLELRVAEEADWDDLGASLQHASVARAARDALHEMGFVQVGAYRLHNMPYPRNFFAYCKAADTFAALFMGDANAQKPHLELYTLFRTVRDGMIGIVTTNAAHPETLDPSEHLIWLSNPDASPAQVFQLHRGKVLEHGKANARAQTAEDFQAAYLTIACENQRVWRERGVLKPAPARVTT
jgi:hypothetical protein